MSRSASRTADALNRSAKRFMRAHPNQALRLPDAGETWVARDHGLGEAPLQEFRERDIIYVVGRTRAGGDARSAVNEWQTNPRAAAWIESHIEGFTRTPCGCSAGVRTVKRGSLFTCTADDCDARFSRLVAEAVVQNRGPVMGQGARGP
ncbi:hypothetical protein [Natronomonas marina]|uniref:hypothetical protein n=1 Tax=Natronomonas marina TaxID=2961939 RepID=UPI0020C9F717|nr:hypothetical protein [Natronomonas marina]